VRLHLGYRLRKESSTYSLTMLYTRMMASIDVLCSACWTVHRLPKQVGLLMAVIGGVVQGHGDTNYTRWYSSNDFYSIKSKHLGYEPYYIIHRQHVPLHDVRFRGYGCVCRSCVRAGLGDWHDLRSGWGLNWALHDLLCGSQVQCNTLI
jgi:hypothetical protein